MTEAHDQTVRIGIGIGGLLALLGIVAYVLSDFASLTALIPTGFGILIVLFGIVGRDPDRRQLSFAGMGVLGLLGFLGSLRAVPDIIDLLTGDSVDSVVATSSQAVMIVLSLVLVIVVGRYFLESR